MMAKEFASDGKQESRKQEKRIYYIYKSDWVIYNDKNMCIYIGHI